LALVVLLALAVSGVGIVLCITRTRAGLIYLAFEAIAIGLLVQEVVGLVALRSGHYSRATIFVLTIAVVGSSTLVWALRRSRRSNPVLDPPPPEVPARDAPAVGALVLLALLVLLGIALVIRQGPSYFIFETGDMGEYVNGANTLANTGHLTASFPHGFTLFLGGTNLLLGQSHTVAGLPALGAALLLGSFACARVVGLHLIAALGIAALVVAHPATVWFSLFPVSESLYAVLLITALYFVVRARASYSYAHAVVAGLVIGLMLLVRGNAMLLAPIIVVTLFASAAVDDERTVHVQRAFTVVALTALSASYAYDVHYPRTYFVQTQLHDLLPKSAFRIADRLHLLDVSVALAISVIVGILLVLRATVLVTRFVRPRVVERPVVFWRVAYGVLVGLTIVALLFVDDAGLVDALARWGPVLLALALVGLTCVVLCPGRYLDGVDGWMLLLVIGSYTLLFAARVPRSMAHGYYLYWDRYLFSEVLPAALVLAAIGVHWFVDAFTTETRLRAVVRIAIAGLCVIAAVGFLPDLRETHRITRYPLFGDAYQTLDRLDSLTQVEGSGAIVYSAPPVPPPGWFFQNTYRAFALPLGLTFRRIVVGMPTDPFGKDVQLDPAAARAKLRNAGFERGYFVSLRAPGAARVASDARTRYLGTVDYVSPILGRSAKRIPAAFRLVPFHFDVYALTST
jgi:hypothetical protein